MLNNVPCTTILSIIVILFKFVVDQSVIFLFIKKLLPANFYIFCKEILRCYGSTFLSVWF